MASLRKLSMAWFQKGTENYPQHTRRKLVVTNVLVTMIVVGSLLFFVGFVLYDPVGLRLPIIVIAILGPLFLLTPVLHPINPYLGSIYNMLVWYVYGLSMAYLLGAGTGFYFLFLIGVTSAILIFGVRHNLISIFNITMQILFFLWAAKVWTGPAPQVVLTTEFENTVFVCMTLFSVSVNFCLVYYAFYQVHRAEALLEQEYEYSERLLANMMPTSIATQLKRDPQKIIAEAHEEATILFADVAGFTERSADRRPEEVVDFLNRLFTRFDALATKHGIEKIKTLGDAFMVAGGMPNAQADHTQRVVEMALDMMQSTRELSEEMGELISLRIGVHSGPVVAGVIGTKKPFYDVWGDTVNLAARLETSGKAGFIQVSDATKDQLGDAYLFTKRGVVELKGKGKTAVWYLTGRA